MDATAAALCVRVLCLVRCNGPKYFETWTARNGLRHAADGPGAWDETSHGATRALRVRRGAPGARRAVRGRGVARRGACEVRRLGTTLGVSTAFAVCEHGICRAHRDPSLEPIGSGQGWTEMGRTSREPAGNANPHAAATQDVASRNLWRPQYRV